ncbi:neuromedin-U receptor 2-like [Clytia hemisphaerica]|uniref:neuromedin-U receptor 2-like n=1 Tax=Clytia hemisphaerica TaxID=252671 RepID=UPI0034D6FA38
MSNNSNNTVVLSQAQIDLFKILGIRNFIWSYIETPMLSFGVLGNLLIIVYFIQLNWNNLKTMSSYHFLLINLALSDALSCGGTAYSLYHFMKPSWEMGTFGCVCVVNVFINICPMASCLLLITTSYARYRRIVTPFKRKLNKIQYSIICLIIWILSSLTYLHYFLNRKVVEINNGTLQCMYFGAEFVNQLFVFAWDILIAVAIMVYFYIKIKKRLDCEENSNHTHLNDSSRQRNQLILRTLKALIVVYTIFAYPGRIFAMIGNTVFYYGSVENPPNQEMMNAAVILVQIVAMILYYSNNIFNVFVYYKVMPEFRAFVLNVLTFGFYKKHNEIHPASETNHTNDGEPS